MNSEPSRVVGSARGRVGYGVSLMSRAGRGEYFKTKFTVSFCLPFGVVFAELAVNLLLCVLLFHRGYQFGGYEDFYESMGRGLLSESGIPASTTRSI